MSIRVAINGFGRIGRLTLRALLERKDKDIKIVAINDLTDLKSIMHLLKYDSLHSELKNNLKIDGDSIFIDDQKISFFLKKTLNLYHGTKLKQTLLLNQLVFSHRKLNRKNI